MSEYEQYLTAPVTPLASPAVHHAEPSVGGSYTRDVDTGELVKAEPAQIDQPEQE